MREQAFHAFFEQHHAQLSGLAYLLSGDSTAADDLAADALTEVWRHWDRVTAAGDPAAYARGIVANHSTPAAAVTTAQPPAATQARSTVRWVITPALSSAAPRP